MSTPGIILIVLLSLDLLTAAHFHGQPKGNYNVFEAALGAAFASLLFYWAGVWG